MEAAFGPEAEIRDVSSEPSEFIPIASDGPDASDADDEQNDEGPNELNEEDKYEFSEPPGVSDNQGIFPDPNPHQNFNMHQGTLPPPFRLGLPIITPSLVWWRGPIPWNELMCAWVCPYCLHPGIMRVHPPQIAPVYMHHPAVPPPNFSNNQAVPSPHSEYYQMSHQPLVNLHEWNPLQRIFPEPSKNCLNPEAPAFNPRAYNAIENNGIGREQQRFIGDQDNNIPQVSVSHVFNHADDNRKGRYIYQRRNGRSGLIYRGRRTPRYYSNTNQVVETTDNNAKTELIN